MAPNLVPSGNIEQIPTRAYSNSNSTHSRPSQGPSYGWRQSGPLSFGASHGAPVRRAQEPPEVRILVLNTSFLAYYVYAVTSLNFREGPGITNVVKNTGVTSGLTSHCMLYFTFIVYIQRLLP